MYDYTFHVGSNPTPSVCPSLRRANLFLGNRELSGKKPVILFAQTHPRVGT